MAQRLVRTLCPHCKTDYRLLLADAVALGDASLEGTLVKESHGCEQCQQTGYSGRQGLYELLVVDQGLTRLIHARAGEQRMADHVASQLTTMLDQGRELVLSNSTSPSEVFRMVQEPTDNAVV